MIHSGRGAKTNVEVSTLTRGYVLYLAYVSYRIVRSLPYRSVATCDAFDCAGAPGSSVSCIRGVVTSFLVFLLSDACPYSYTHIHT